ncbi:MAG: hypothetical protein A3D93_01480 [Acidobacteria bacterium RIFCSPHIGHO2_12_FULL_67_30]|nr:MAG: hypothetical protein A3B65_00195 [Acidobacteria bacterium RIFCSPHIGHO2_02_FULL_67_57]OFV85640.1 MAG: hypothetical protein A2620_03750 [Acidobacteria bacterium RIFCSPHIGHO2_01_FULL_67_28]OFV89990.1 MAG: hypothetical protein A3D93_01480 [Acidobacteria bacterium RIFCSPHIGHO2_12_FULL_67_30]
MSMPATPLPAGGQLLACMNCGEQRTLPLDRSQLNELMSRQEVRLFCPDCHSLTSWSGVEPDRRNGTPRRAARRVRMELPIRVRCQSPQLSFNEVTHTLNASRDGACLVVHQPLREGMEVFLLMPYHEGETLPEMRAKVVRVDKYGDVWEVGVEFAARS